MSEAVGTLPFLATMWLLVVLGVRILEESGAKIAAALKGTPRHHPPVEGRMVRIRIRHASPATAALPQLRAAA